MLGKFLDRLDGKLYNSWQEKSLDLATTFTEGLNKIEFTPPPPEEIQKINAALIKLNSNISREEFVKLMKEVQSQLDALAKNKQFNNPHVNAFIFQANRTFSWLNGALLTDYNKYVEAVLNPTGKEQEVEASGFIEHKLIGKGAKNIANTLMKGYENEAEHIFKAEVKNLKAGKNITVDSPTDISKDKVTVSPLELAMGKENYAATQSPTPVKTPEDISLYLSEQIYGKSFEMMYTQIATIVAIKKKIKKLAAQGSTEEEIAQIQKNLYQEAGLNEVNSKEGNEYLNTIASALGFKNADELYRNYKKLGTPEGYNIYKDLKSEFMSNSSKDILANQDPLETIKKATRAENERLKSKLKKSDYEKSNLNYVKNINFLANEVVGGIETAQRGRNVVQLVAEDYLKMENLVGKNPGFVAQFAMNALDMVLNKYDFKQYLDSLLLGKVNNQNQLLINNLNDNAAQINHAWVKNNINQIAKKYEQRDEIVKDAKDKSIDDSPLINNYISAMLEYKKHFKEYNEIAKKHDSHDPVRIHANKVFRESEAKYNNYKQAFEITASASIYKATENAINNTIDARQLKIEELQTKLKDKVNQIEKLNAQIQQEDKKSKGFLPTVASWFGIKSSSVINKEKLQKQLDQLYVEIEPIGLALHVQRELLEKATQQKNEFKNSQKNTVVELKDKISNLAKSYSQCYDNMAKMQPDSLNDPTNPMWQSQVEFSNTGNQLNIALATLVNKLSNKEQMNELMALPLSDIENFQKSLAQLRDSEFSKKLIGELYSPDLKSQLTKLNAQLDNAVQQKKQIAQEQVLAQAKKVASTAFTEYSFAKLINPFQHIAITPESTFSDLTPQSIESLYQHAQKEVLALLKKTDTAQIPSEEVEQLFSSYQENIYQLSNKDEPTALDKQLLTHFQSLANVITLKIREERNKIKALSVSDLSKNILDLNSDLLHYKHNLDKATANAQKTKDIMGSWIWNPFGFTTVETLRKAQSQVHSAGLLLNEREQDSIELLENYLQKVAPLFEAMEYDTLKEQIVLLEHSYQTLQQDGISSEKISKAFNEVLTKARDAEKSHSVKDELAIYRAIEDNRAKMTELKNLNEIINKELSANADVNAELISQFNNLLTQIKKNVTQIRESIQNYDKKIESLAPKHQAIGVNRLEEVMLRKTIGAALEGIELELLKQNNESLEFYAAISSKNMPDFSKVHDKQTLGKGLLMALKHHNHNVVNKLLTPPQNAQPKIESFELSAALSIAAKMGDLKVVKKIFNYRNDVVFSNEQLNNAFQEALANKKNDVVNYFVFNTDFTPDNDTLKTIIAHSPDDSTISSVDRGWKQMITDNDGETLEQMRTWFVFLQQTSDSLKLEADLIKQKAAKNIPQGQLSDVLKEDMNALLRKIGKLESLKDKSRSYFKNYYFETPDRKEAHLVKWSKEIDDALQAYHQLIGDIIDPPKVQAPTIEIPKIEKSITELEIEAQQVELETQTTFTKMQKLAQAGVIVPDIIRTELENPQPVQQTVKHDEVIAPIQTNNKQQPKDSKPDIKSQIHGIQEQIDALLNNRYFESPVQLAKLNSLLTDFKHFAKEPNTEIFNGYLQKAIYQMAKDNKTDTLETMLEYVNQDRMKEVLTTALSQAIHAGKDNVVSLLMKHKAFEGHENDLLEKLLKIVDEKNEGQLEARHVHAPRMIFDLLTHAQVRLIDPKTQQFDERIAKILIDMSNNAQSKMDPVIRSWGFSDNDKPKLEQLREAYVFAESALEKISMSAYLTLQPLMEADPDSLSETEVMLLEQKLKQIESSYATQLQAIETITKALAKSRQDIPFDNLARKEEYTNKWDSKLEEKQKKITKEIAGNIKDATKVLGECHNYLEKAKEKAQTPEKRKSVLLSQGTKRATTSQEESYTPDEPTPKRRTPNSY